MERLQPPCWQAILNGVSIAAGASQSELQGYRCNSFRNLQQSHKMARPVTSIDDIKHIVYFCADPLLVILLRLWIRWGGSVTIEESRSIELSDVTEGFRFSAGYCASAFVNDERRNVMSYEEPLVMVTDYKITQ